MPPRLFRIAGFAITLISPAALHAQILKYATHSFRDSIFDYLRKRHFDAFSSSGAASSQTLTSINSACTPDGLTLSPPAIFGQITSTINSTRLVGTGTPRVLEFALRLTY